MQANTAPSPFRLPPVEPKRPLAGNEFSAAVAKLVERRGRIVVERPPVLPQVDPVDDDAAPAWPWLSLSPAIRGVLVALPVIVMVMALVWLFTGGAAPVPAGSIRIATPSRPVAPPAVTAPAAESRPAVAAIPSAPEPATTPASASAPGPAPVAASQPLGRDEVREVQVRLSALGFATGPADGVAGPQTQAALRRYADARGVAGRDLDRALLLRLRAEAPQSR